MTLYRSFFFFFVVSIFRCLLGIGSTLLQFHCRPRLISPFHITFTAKLKERKIIEHKKERRESKYSIYPNSGISD